MLGDTAREMSESDAWYVMVERSSSAEDVANLMEALYRCFSKVGVRFDTNEKTLSLKLAKPENGIWGGTWTSVAQELVRFSDILMQVGYTGEHGHVVRLDRDALVPPMREIARC